MEDESAPTRDSSIITAVVGESQRVGIQVTRIGTREEDVANVEANFSTLTDSLEAVAKAIVGTFQNIKPKKGVVEFGVEVGIEQGKLTALIVKGTAKANLKVTLEWS